MFRCSTDSPYLFKTERFLKDGGIVTTAVGKCLAEKPYRERYSNNLRLHPPFHKDPARQTVIPSASLSFADSDFQNLL